jgi:membrane-bound lytic murein transglycosylase D
MQSPAQAACGSSCPSQGAYGLTRNGWVDERFDPEKSSLAYARYMKILYNQFGDWYLAMAAYNWGPGNVQRAVMRTGYADFWELYKRNALPTATKNYVPGIIAAIIMAKNPQQYGLGRHGARCAGGLGHRERRLLRSICGWWRM